MLYTSENGFHQNVMHRSLYAKCHSNMLHQHMQFSPRSGYLNDEQADKNPYRHDSLADKDSYPGPDNCNIQCLIRGSQLSFVMINVH